MAEKKQLNYNPAAVREELMRMLEALSYDALQYVWRPILYAYNWMDDHDQDAMTEDDIYRFCLIGDVARQSPEHVAKVANYSGYLVRLSFEAKTRS